MVLAHNRQAFQQIQGAGQHRVAHQRLCGPGAAGGASSSSSRSNPSLCSRTNSASFSRPAWAAAGSAPEPPPSQGRPAGCVGVLQRRKSIRKIRRFQSRAHRHRNVGLHPGHRQWRTVAKRHRRHPDSQPLAIRQRKILGPHRPPRRRAPPDQPGTRLAHHRRERLRRPGCSVVHQDGHRHPDRRGVLRDGTSPVPRFKGVRTSM